MKTTTPVLVCLPWEAAAAPAGLALWQLVCMGALRQGWCNEMLCPLFCVLSLLLQAGVVPLSLSQGWHYELQCGMGGGGLLSLGWDVRGAVCWTGRALCVVAVRL